MLIVIGGPTATGKSALALRLAKKYHAAIINGDAFQVYQKMNIGTAKPSDEERKLVPSYLYDYVSPSANYSIKEYQKDFRKTVDKLYAEGYKYIIVVGGSGLYIRAAIYDYDFQEAKVVNMSDLEDKSLEELHIYLRNIDEKEAEKIHFHNRKRVLRAIEIYRQSGMRKSEIINMQEHRPLYHCIFCGISPTDKELLYQKIDERVEEMFAMGLVDEVQTLFGEYGNSIQAFKAIGYKEFLPYFANQATLEETKTLIKKNTRAYSKRQITFFTHQFLITWFISVEEAYNALSRFMAGEINEFKTSTDN